MTAIARLKIALDDGKPQILRRIEVPVTIRLDRLHLAIQAAMGWTNTHRYEIRAGDISWGEPDEELWGGGPLDARKTRLLDVLKDSGTKASNTSTTSATAGNTIKIERTLDPSPGIDYPLLLQAVGRSPPEDVGGPPGYAEFLEALADPKHQRHDLIQGVGR
jgi:hypothetical protein